MSDDDRMVLLPPVRPEGYEDFASHTERTIDDKGRIILPNYWREFFRDGGRLTEWRGRLALWTNRSWRDTASKLHAAELRGELPRGAREAFHVYTELVTVDGQGRVPLPAAYRERVGIGGPGSVVSIAGLGDHLAITPAGRTIGLSQDEFQAAIENLNI